MNTTLNKTTWVTKVMCLLDVTHPCEYEKNEEKTGNTYNCRVICAFDAPLSKTNTLCTLNTDHGANCPIKL